MQVGVQVESILPHCTLLHGHLGGGRGLLDLWFLDMAVLDISVLYIGVLDGIVLDMSVLVVDLFYIVVHPGQ